VEGVATVKEREPAPSQADVVVIGGGITGCATAFSLARRGVKAVLLEKGEIASEQSGRAWGFVRQQGRHPAELPLAKVASTMWEEISRELDADVEFVRGGILALAETQSDVARLEEGAKVAAENGLSTRMVGPPEIRKISPELAGRWQGGLFTPDDAHAEPEKATRAFAEAARRHGAILRSHTPAIGIDLTNGAVSGVNTPLGLVRAGGVVCAAGIWSARVARWAGFTVPLQIVRSSVAETRPTAPFTRTAVWGPYVAFRPTPRGTFYLGNGYRGAGADYDITLASFRHLRYFLPNYLRNWRSLKVRVGRDLLADMLRVIAGSGTNVAGAGLTAEPQVNQRKIAHNERRFYELFPALSGLGLGRAWAGYIDLAPDLIPVLGEVGTPGGFYLAAGFSGHGFALGPVVGRLLSELIVDGRPSLDLKPFRPGRFAEGEVLRARRVL
jgi:glycine/D-amino acid oxidase-like deaminating enzyme